MRLRSTLLLLSVATAVPLAIVSFIAVGYVFENENTTVSSTALTRNRATLEAVDAELRGTINTLYAITTSKSIARKDFAAFHAEAREALATQRHWRNIVLHDKEGRQLVNARLPWGSELLRTLVEPVSFKAAVASASPAIGNITFAPRLDNEPGVAVRVPVMRDARVEYVITAVLNPSTFQSILENQKLPAGWVSGLVGSDGRFIARVPVVPPGSLASDDYRKRIAAESEGWYRGRTLEGRDTYTAHSRSTLTSWTIGYAIPAEALVGGPTRAAALLATGAFLSFISALLIGYWLSRRIARPIAELAVAASQLHAGTAPPALSTAIGEVSALGEALRQTAAAIRQRDDELMRKSEELAVQADELRKIDEHKTRFLAQISHELRGPLTPLRNASQLLALTNDPRVQDEAKAVIRRQLGLLTRLVNDFVDIGRISRGQLDLQLAPTSLERVANESVEMVKPQMDAKQQVLVVRHSPAALQVDGDADRLVQVLSNLLTNASRYSPEGSVIELVLARAGETAVAAVIDKGVGFTPAEAARMFDMFVRLAQPGEGVPGSLGIGLAVTRAIVDLHGGRIDAHSEGPGKGATFTVSLPLAVSLAVPAATASPAVAK